MRNTDNNKTKIRLTNILKIKRHLYFTEDKSIARKYFKKLNTHFKYKSIILMLNAMLRYKSNETLLVMDNHGNYMIASGSDSSEVRISSKIKDWVSNSVDRNFASFHNHPNNSLPSLSDLYNLYYKFNMMFVIVITNDCRYIRVFNKPELKYKENKETREEIENYMRENSLGPHDNCLELARKLVSENKLYWKEFRNY